MRSKAHLRFVASLSCAACGRQPAGVAHHHGRARHGGGTGIKVGDDKTAPLCWTEHQEYHQRLRIGAWSVEETDRRLTEAAEQAAKLSRQAGILPAEGVANG